MVFSYRRKIQLIFNIHNKNADLTCFIETKQKLVQIYNNTFLSSWELYKHRKSRQDLSWTHCTKAIK